MNAVNLWSFSLNDCYCHSPLPDWIVDVDGLGSDEDTAVQRNFQKGILATDLNFHTNVRINCD